MNEVHHLYTSPILNRVPFQVFATVTQVLKSHWHPIGWSSFRCFRGWIQDFIKGGVGAATSIDEVAAPPALNSPLSLGWAEHAAGVAARGLFKSPNQVRIHPPPSSQHPLSSAPCSAGAGLSWEQWLSWCQHKGSLPCACFWTWKGTPGLEGGTHLLPPQPLSLTEPSSLCSSAGAWQEGLFSFPCPQISQQKWWVGEGVNGRGEEETCCWAWRGKEGVPRGGEFLPALGT